MKDVLLGRTSEIPKEYDPSILTSLSRLDSRIKSGLGEHSSILQGRDFWTSYEASWLNFKGIPQNKILNISYNSNSKFFVESKSLKLYLFSLNNKKFNFNKFNKFEEYDRIVVASGDHYFLDLCHKALKRSKKLVIVSTQHCLSNVLKAIPCEKITFEIQKNQQENFGFKWKTEIGSAA